MRHELKKMALEEEQPGEALLKYLWKNYGSSRIADDQKIYICMHGVPCGAMWDIGFRVIFNLIIATPKA